MQVKKISQETVDFFESMGIKIYYSTAHRDEQGQNGLPKAAIDSIMMISRTIMVESGLRRRFWFKYAMAGCDARNVIHKERIGTTPWRLMHGGKKMYPDFAFGCRAWVYLKKKEERTESIHSEQLRQSTLDSNLTQACIHS
jgi:hypothetical protein